MPRSSACRSTSAAAWRAATAWRSSSEASPTASRPGAPRSWSATSRSTSASPQAPTAPPTSRPTARRAASRLPAASSAFRLLRGWAREGEGPDRLAAVTAPGPFAEGGDRLERFLALVFVAAEQIGPGSRRHLEGHFVVREEQRPAVHRFVEALHFQLRVLGQIRAVLDLHAAVLERVDHVDRQRHLGVGPV